ncbi:MAG: hypothetical protein EBX36_07135, partial [Planctomycetia bacterium]|nr:hypothetical protein [Planctomycetia bacterium]
AGDGGDDVAVDTSQLKRMLSVDEQAEANLAKARGIASSLEAAQERLAKVDPRAAARPAQPAMPREPAAGRVGGGQATPDVSAAKPSAIPDAATVIAAALARHRAGQRDEALDMLRTAIDAREKPGAEARGVQRAEVADLLVAVADLRIRSLEWTEPVQLLSRALTVASTAVGDNHPTTLVSAVRLASAFRAKGDVAAAKDLDELVAAKVVATAQKASKPQLESIREAVRGGATIAVAVGDREASVRCLDTLLQTGTDLDDRTLIFAFELLARLLPPGTDDPAAAAVRSRCLQIARQAVGSRPVLSGMVQHHLALAEAHAGRLPQAAALLQKAADVDRQILGTTHPRVAYHLLELASIRARAGDNAGAQALATEVRAIESAVEQANAAMVGDLRRLAAVHTDRREFDAAAKLLVAALAAQEKAPDKSALAMAEIAEQSARLSLARGQFQRAKDLLAEAATIVQSGYGAGHPAAVAALLRRERATQQQEQLTKSVASRSGSNFAAFLAKKEGDAAASGRRPPATDGPARSAAADADGSTPTDQAAMGPASPEAEKARRAFDAAMRLYGGDPSKRKKSGAGREGLEKILAYSGAIANMANEGGSAPDPGPVVTEPTAGGTQPSDPQRQPPRRPSAAPQPAPAVERPRPSPFVAASRSGLRQRTALARRRAASAPVKASTSVDDLMLAAWSAHERGSRSEAIATCEEALSQSARESGDSSRPVADVLDQYATIAIAQGDLVRGKQLLERLGSMRWKLLGPNDPQVADAAARLAGLLADCGEYERALPLAKTAMSARLQAAASHPAGAAEALLLLGMIELGRGDPAAAAARVEEARPLLATADASAGDAADSRLAAARLSLVRLLTALGDSQVASDEADRLVADVSGARPVGRE